MASGRIFVIGFWMCLLTFTVHSDSRHFNGITLIQFCSCWNASITRTGNDLYVDITFVKKCWESPLKKYGGFQIIPYKSTMLFKISVKESLQKMLKVKELKCQLNKGCFTTISMVRDTSLEIIPFCNSCDSCMGKETDYISYTHQKRSRVPEVVTTKPKNPLAPESYKSRFLVMAGVVTIVATIATFVIIMLVCRINKNRIQRRGPEQQSLVDVGSDTTDAQTDVSIPIEPNSPTEQPNTRIRRQSVKIGVFHPHIPKELSSQATENPLDAHVQRMINILTSVQELDVNYLTTNLTNLFEGIDEVSSSPKIILVLCDRFSELCHEGSAQNGNITEEKWTDTESNLLKRIREKYYLNNTCLYFVNFKHFKQQNNALADARVMFTSQSYKVFSIDYLGQSDDHFKQLLDSILSDVICDSEARSIRIMSLLSQDLNTIHVSDAIEQRFMSLCE
ncbi:uncharacterized protein LOC110461203 [Mizuhopecten yessoensis]|uniref:SEFIR domain-containing protein n=1 Tax=Mizuhopecten yessoensis TaxID=6573 RepID=A0A210Q0S5_MIZYE|nr:uncharacterized protein LOC110461203 [Mizuhopecten yessoensis]OWF42338.1 hypothetical protein KP79_PYT11941 [Mizuhopecten yessoensis]